jgi:hypothetical protein
MRFLTIRVPLIQVSYCYKPWLKNIVVFRIVESYEKLIVRTPNFFKLFA